MNAMWAIDRYLSEVASTLQVRGRVRRRFLQECRDHLVDATSERGEEEAIRAFGPAEQIASGFDAEVAAQRGMWSTFVSSGAVLAAGGSTLALIHAASSDANAPTVWAITFFIGAQLAGLAAGLALLQALAMRRSQAPPADTSLLLRRNACALVAAGLTILSAGGALSGQGSAALIMAGPALLCVALAMVLRVRSLARHLDGSRAKTLRPPLKDIAQLIRRPLPSVDPYRLLLVVTCIGAAAAFVRDRAEQGTVSGALGVAGIEAAAIVACFLLLGPALGLWRRTASPTG